MLLELGVTVIHRYTIHAKTLGEEDGGVGFSVTISGAKGRVLASVSRSTLARAVAAAFLEANFEGVQSEFCSEQGHRDRQEALWLICGDGGEFQITHGGREITVTVRQLDSE